MLMFISVSDISDSIMIVISVWVIMFWVSILWVWWVCLICMCILFCVDGEDICCDIIIKCIVLLLQGVLNNCGWLLGVCGVVGRLLQLVMV